MEYPINFPDIKKEINGFYLQESFKTLMPYEDKQQYLDDNVINAYFSVLPFEARLRGFKLLSFDVFFAAGIVSTGSASSGFKKWASTIRAWDYPIWLIPVNYRVNIHWSLYVVLHESKTIMYIDSLHGSPYTKMLDGICEFLEENAKGDLWWHEWTVYVAKDIPSQVKDDEVGGNCGVHICTWAYTIASGSLYHFPEDDMFTARKGIAIFIMEAQVKEKDTNQIQVGRGIIYSEAKERKSSVKIKRQKVSQLLQVTKKCILGFDRTNEMCASLHVILSSNYSSPITRSSTRKKV